MGRSDDDSAAYGELIDALRDLQDAVAASAPDRVQASPLTAALRRTADELRCAGTDPALRRFGRLDVTGRGQTMCPPLLITHLGAERLRGTLAFTAFHGGFGEHAHGGAVAMVMNEVMGTLANVSPSIVRVAAFVHVNYRSAVPLGAVLQVRADVSELAGRKQTVAASLVNGQRTLADGEGLFLSLPPAVPGPARC